MQHYVSLLESSRQHYIHLIHQKNVSEHKYNAILVSLLSVLLRMITRN
jgi:hypothetical protein